MSRWCGYVITEHLPLYRKRWYQLALTWNKTKHRLRTYVNGILCGATDYPLDAQASGDALYLGNTAMAFASLQIYNTELPGANVASGYTGKDPTTQAELLDLFTVRPRPLPTGIPLRNGSLRTNSPSRTPVT